VYARVHFAAAYCEPELECRDLVTQLAAGYGPLVTSETSHVIAVSLGAARRLLTGQAPVLRLLGKQVPFECAVGANGRVWIRAASVENVWLVARILKELAGVLDEKACKRRVKEFMSEM